MAYVIIGIVGMIAGFLLFGAGFFFGVLVSMIQEED